MDDILKPTFSSTNAVKWTLIPNVIVVLALSMDTDKL